MQFRKLSLTNFRNHAFSSFDLGRRIVGIAGGNGSGKTTVLDAIHFLAVGKGLTTSTDQAYLMDGATFFRLEAIADSEGEEDKIVIKYQSGKGKALEVNDKKISRLGDHVGRYPVVSVIPQDIDLLLSGSKERRRVLDITFSQIDGTYLEALIHYGKLIRQRNALLKKSQKDGRVDWDLLQTYDHKIYPHVHLIFEKRTEYCKRLSFFFEQYYTKLSGGAESVDFQYRSQLQEGNYGELTARCTERDRIMGRSHTGVHKDDLEFTLINKKIRDVASQGQLKSAVLSLKMAGHSLIRERLGIEPAFLLDDLFDRLDKRRASEFLSLVRDHTQGQIFITDTNAERLTDSVGNMDEKFTIFLISDGEINSIVDQ
ncbi:MAG: DNA replication/repair protein RecF [Saprospirales bacterium]|nr:MAG: DNA replication/repair protein RecF [Saprospirales bacterium]